MSSASVSALLTKEPNQIKLSTRIALCTALDCTPNDLCALDTTALERPATPSAVRHDDPKAIATQGHSNPPLLARRHVVGNRQGDCAGCGARSGSSAASTAAGVCAGPTSRRGATSPVGMTEATLPVRAGV